MAEAAVSFAVETLGKLLIDKAVFLKGVKGEVEWVRDELKRMQSFLRDAANKQSDRESIRNWISDIRKVAHDAEDVIELFVLNVQSRGMLERCICFPKQMYHLNKVGGEIQSIRRRLTAIEDSRRRYGIEGVEPSARTRSQEEVETRRRLPYWQNDKHVVGLDKDVKILLRNAIFHKKEGLTVSAILGMGGIGKSTLAHKIYSHPAVVDEFNFRAWVVVSSEFTTEEILKQILVKLGISPNELTILGSAGDKLRRQEGLKEEVFKFLTGKRYFIVLDDVWEAAHWESLSTAFPNEDKSSRVLLTSRNQVISSDCGYVHHMNVLGIKESWDLFLRKTFAVDNAECPEELKKIGEDMLKKCNGLPLAISVVGGLLARKARSKSEWEKVLKEMKSHVDRSKDLSTISAILELSYQNLSPELKACFLCLGFFKEDAVIRAKDLVHIWVALGLVAQQVVGEDETAEDVAREYLNELISRNMVHVLTKRPHDEVKGCHVHDLLRDLSIRKAKEEIDFEAGVNNSHLDKPRHRALNCRALSSVRRTEQNQCLRSLFIHTEEAHVVDSLGPSSRWKIFELLRVLYFGNDVYIRVLPEAIGSLIGLRYIRMSYMGEETKLPRSWAKLKNLEVLYLLCSDVRIIIDHVILKMDRLRLLRARMRLSFSGDHVPLVRMRNLETLIMLKVKDSDVGQIQGMSTVSKLGIDTSEMSNPTTIFTHLSMLENLDCLSLRDSKFGTAIDKEGVAALHRVTRLKLYGFTGTNRLTEGHFPPNLSHLTLNDMYLTYDPMPILEKLPRLLYLKLVSAYISGGEQITISSRGFPTLKLLHLRYVMLLTDIAIEEGGAPVLDQIIVRDCQNFKASNLPERIKCSVNEG